MGMDFGKLVKLAEEDWSDQEIVFEEELPELRKHIQKLEELLKLLTKMLESSPDSKLPEDTLKQLTRHLSSGQREVSALIKRLGLLARTANETEYTRRNRRKNRERYLSRKQDEN